MRRTSAVVPRLRPPVIAILGLALCLWPARADIVVISERGLTVEEAVRYALEHHPALVAARQGVEVAKLGYAAADAIGDPTLDGSAQLLVRGPITSIEFPDPNTGQTRRLQIGKPYNGTLTLQAAAPLNLGAQRRAARRATDAEVGIAQEAVRQLEQAIALGVRQVFYSLLLLEHMRVIALDNVDLAEAHFRLAEAKFAAGVVAQYDVDRAEADVASARAKLASAEGAVRAAMAQLSRAMGLDPADRVQVWAELVPDFVAVNEAQARAKALDRPEVRSLRWQAALARAGADAADLEDKPIISLFGTTGYTVGSGFTEGVQYSLGIQASWPIANGRGDEARQRKLLEQAIQAELALRDKTEEINTGIRAALEGLATARAGIEDAAQAVVKARDAVQRIRLAYENDVGAWIDLRDASSGLVAAEQAFVTKLFEYRLALADLQYAIGVEALGDLAVPDPSGPPTVPDLGSIGRPSAAPPVPEPFGLTGGPGSAESAGEGRAVGGDS